MLTIFIPLLVDEVTITPYKLPPSSWELLTKVIVYKLQSSFFAHFMCFEVPALVPPGGVTDGNKGVPNDTDNDNDNDDDLGIMDIDDNDKAGNC